MLKTSRNRTTRCGIGYTCLFGAGSNDFLTLVKGGLYDTDISNIYSCIAQRLVNNRHLPQSRQTLALDKIYNWEGNFIVGAKLPKGMIINQIAFVAKRISPTS